eukprot:CAMPEP_0202726906 /NCGR_PEP_ID=MMETSP1385-20130828/184850_1 /ASSEMBLY_ACC=CAM_ASM_000861 /TAXON_ID=933848 /ORGANISM="Elphidium margaritaceum" /LENGTH=682 /DNA_ID=CAMNT_0049393135 /DNA_START=86 /DNA_END=2133 /DNA_ORIENTATION=+
MQLYSLLLAFVAVLSEDIYLDDGDCPRIRRPLSALSQEEVMLYVSGLQAIRDNGRFTVMSNAHAHHTAIHAGSSFFFYHTYFVWEVETQIRALGGKWRCFSLPYYDFTVDANEEIPSILKSVFGGDGDPDNNLCVTGKMWSVERWPLYEENLCAEDEDPEQGCCLKRHVGKEIEIADAEKMGDVIAENDQFLDFLTQIAYEHQQVHWLFAKEGCDICAMATGRSPEDPIFMLLHSFVAYLRGMWASCYGYNLIPAEELDQHPEVYTAQCRLDVGPGNCDVIELDEAYVFDRMSVESWSIVSEIDVTPRMMWDFADWGVQYEVGDFYPKSGLAEKCPVKNFLKDNEWFYLNRALNGEDDDEQAFEATGVDGEQAFEASGVGDNEWFYLNRALNGEDEEAFEATGVDGEQAFEASGVDEAGVQDEDGTGGQQLPPPPVDGAGAGAGAGQQTPEAPVGEDGEQQLPPPPPQEPLQDDDEQPLPPPEAPLGEDDQQQPPPPLDGSPLPPPQEPLEDDDEPQPPPPQEEPVEGDEQVFAATGVDDEQAFEASGVDEAVDNADETVPQHRPHYPFEDPATDDVDAVEETDETVPQHRPHPIDGPATDEDEQEAFVQMESLQDGAVKKPSMSVNVVITVVMLSAVFLFGAMMWYKSSRQVRKKLAGDKDYEYTLIDTSNQKSNYGALNA